MALEQDAYQFEDVEHGIVQEGPLTTPLIVGAFNGVLGVSIIADESKEQMIFCRAVLQGYDDLPELDQAIGALRFQQGKLTGTLTVSGDIDQEFKKCTFVAFELERKFYDGSGVNDWCAFGRLVWIRRAQE